jgi:two-component system, NtrC family, nitrogen regulation response regulator GlnG
LQAMAGPEDASPEWEPTAGLAVARPAEISEQTLIDSLRKNAWKTGVTATELGMSRTTLYAMMERSKNIRKAKDLSSEEILSTYSESGKDLERCSQRLEVSERGLKLRIKELGLDLGN